MGSGKWTYNTTTVYSSTIGSDVWGKSAEQIYVSRGIDPLLSPYGVGIRESRDSVDNPNSNALIVALDVTGSMGSVLETAARNLNVLAETLFSKKILEDAHIMFMGIGDVAVGDKAPLQVTQFEADIRIAEQLLKLYFERGGGGNNYESYALAWYFGAFHTSIDCFEKRKKRGYLFTIGDECPTPRLYEQEIQKVMGSTSVSPQGNYYTGRDLLNIVSTQYNVFHIMVAQGNYFSRGGGDRAKKEWSELLGQRAILLPDITKLSELIVSTISINEGTDLDTAVEIWDDPTAKVLRGVLDSLNPVRPIE